MVRVGHTLPAADPFPRETTASDGAGRRNQQAIRPAVVTRKVCGGNRTPSGAATQQTLASVLRTAAQQ